MPQKQFEIKRHLSSATLLVCTLLVGCQSRARTDLYVDSMAAEIRDLEDQLYHYDHEYRLLEQELETLRRRNAAMSEQVGKSQSHQLQLVPKASSPLDITPRKSDSSSSPGTSQRKVEEVAPPKSRPSGSGEQSKPDITIEGDLTTPSILNTPQAPTPLPSPSSENLPPPNNAPALPPLDSPQSKSSRSGDLEFNASDLVVPSITTGSLTPPSIDPRQMSVSPDRDLEMSLSQVEIPSQLTTGQSNSARISSAVQVVTDKRVVELAFNAALTRAVSFDDDNQDDGLYLVLLPKNEQGQVVAEAAAVSIEVIDPSRQNEQAVIGQWTYSSREVEGKIQPLGSKQGIHLTLPWNGPNPKSDKVLVVATYQFANGRKLVAKKEIYLNHNSGLKTVWTPRAASRSEVGNSPQAPVVVTASANFPVSDVPSQPVSSVGTYAAPESAPDPAATSSEFRW